jgi:hypothetical protein
VEPETIKNWFLLDAEAHTISKIAALLDRPDSAKGAKDAREVLAMLYPDDNSAFEPVDFAYAIRILFDATAGPIEGIRTSSADRLVEQEAEEGAGSAGKRVAERSERSIGCSTA